MKNVNKIEDSEPNISMKESDSLIKLELPEWFGTLLSYSDVSSDGKYVNLDNVHTMNQLNIVFQLAFTIGIPYEDAVNPIFKNRTHNHKPHDYFHISLHMAGHDKSFFWNKQAIDKLKSMLNLRDDLELGENSLLSALKRLHEDGAMEVDRLTIFTIYQNR